MVYCRKTTEEHFQSVSHSDCLIELNQMITKEGAACSIFNSNWIVLDLDALEIKLKSIARRSNQYKTCDFAAGIKLNNAAKMMLVECRLRYKSANNLSAAELNEKIDGSITLLGHVPSVHNSVYFIFTDRVCSMAKRKLRELKSNRKEFIAATVSEFKDILKFRARQNVE
jgi:hypothetical protein